MKRWILLTLLTISGALIVFFIHSGKPAKPIVAKFVKPKTDDSLVLKKLEKINTYKKADSLYYADAYDSAIYYFDRTLFGLPLSNDSEMKQQMLNRIGYSYILKADYRNASIYLKEAVRLLNKKDTSLTNAITYDYVGTLKSYTQEFDSALAYFRKAEPIYIKTIGENNLMFIKFLVRLANTFKNSGEISKTEKYYLKALQLVEKFDPAKNSELYVNILNSIESNLMLKRDYNKALSYGIRALEIASKNKGSERFLENSYANVGNAYIYLGNYKKAIESFIKALEANERSPYISKGSRKVVLSTLAEVYYMIKEYPKALFYCNEANKIEVNELNYYDVISHISLIQGLTNKEMGNLNIAVAHLKKSLVIRRQYSGEKSFNTSESYLWLGKYFESINLLDSALSYYQKALISASNQFNSQDISKNPFVSDCVRPSFLIPYVEAKANALENKYAGPLNSTKYLIEALNCYKLIDSLIVFSRRSMDTEDSRLYLSSTRSQLYEKAIDCAYELYTITRNEEYTAIAFQFIEKNKYLLVLENLNTAEAASKTGIPDSLVEIEKNCNIELNFIKDKLNKEQKRENIDTLRIRQLNYKEFGLVRQLEKVHNIMSQKYPNYFNVKFGLTSCKLKDIQSYSLAKKARIVEYFWGINSIYAIDINGDKFDFIKIKNDPELQRILNEYIVFCQSIHLGSREPYKEYMTNAQNLYEILLNPSGKRELPQETVPGNLIIIPDGLLSKLSFEALIASCPQTNTISYKNRDCLIYHYNIQYAYSSNILINKSSNNAREANRLIGFGYSDKEALRNSHSLPGTYNELKGISKYYKSRLYFGENATVDNFKQNAQDNDIIHLALHGEADSENDTITSLIFQPGKNKAQEKHLYRNEIYELNLKAKMVVLSACETGLGKNYKGEGVFSMSRAFSYAGCPTVVLTLWDVTDQSTAALMTDFYRQLSKGLEVSKALRKAKLEYLNKCDEIGSQPAFWASFVVYGDISPIKSTKNDILWILLCLIFVISIVYTIYFKLKNHKIKNSQNLIKKKLWLFRQFDW